MPEVALMVFGPVHKSRGAQLAMLVDIAAGGERGNR